MSAWLAVTGLISLLIAIGAGSTGDLIILITLIASPAAILMAIVGLAISRSTRKGAIAEALMGGLLGLSCLIFLFLATPSIGPVMHRMRSSNNLRSIGTAIHSYHDVNHKLPSAIRDRNGKPLLSWRVAILPYIEGDNMLPEFHVSEPWDSPHNLTLLDQMPAIYRSPREKKSSGTTMTYYRFVTGPGTAFEREGITIDDIKDGLSNTIFVLEAGDAVPWTKPDEWEYRADQPLPPVGGIFGPPKWYEIRRGHQNGTNVVFGDGSVWFLPRDTPEQTWRAFITRDGGEKVEHP
jgi:prepilin-type processing-associated H-X9-DG protein